MQTATAQRLLQQTGLGSTSTCFFAVHNSLANVGVESVLQLEQSAKGQPAWTLRLFSGGDEVLSAPLAGLQVSHSGCNLALRRALCGQLHS